MLKLKKSAVGTPCFELFGAPSELRDNIKRVIQANHLDDPDYQARIKAQPFIQGDDDHDGWLFIEFWQRWESAEEFVNYLNVHPDFSTQGAEQYSI